jgi:hypothetical protein
VGEGELKEGVYKGTLPNGCEDGERLVVLKREDLEEIVRHPMEKLLTEHASIALEALLKSLLSKKIKMGKDFYNKHGKFSFPDEIVFEDKTGKYRLFLDRHFYAENRKDMIFVRYVSVDQANEEEEP